jgi:hypothetical protein
VGFGFAYPGKINDASLSPIFLAFEPFFGVREGCF